MSSTLRQNCAATTRRWTTQDPLGFAAGDANLYRYVGNRATLLVDPSGNIVWFVAIPLVLGVGGFTWLTGSTALTADRTTGRWSDASTWRAYWDGLRLGSQSTVNGLASAARSLLTLGVWNEPWEVWAVDQVDWPVYQEGVLAARFGWELLPTAGIARLTQAAGQMGRWGRWALGWDAGQNAVQAGRGGWDISENGLTWSNGLQVVGSLLGLGGNYATWRRLPAGGAAPRTWQDFLPEAQMRLQATKAKYGNVEAQMMAMSRKDALKRLNGLTPKIEEHLQKIANDPMSRDLPHWTREVENWIRQMEKVLPYIGDKTAAEWAARIAEWKARLGG